MADIMTLDMSGAGGDDGLLVPFSRPTAPAGAAQSRPNEMDALFSKQNSGRRQGTSSRGFGGFFRRSSNHRDKENEEQKNLPLKATTFAFPKARVEQAEIEPDPFTKIITKKNEKQPQDESDEDESSGEEESDDDDDDETDEDEEKPKAPPTPSLKKVGDWDPSENPYYAEEREQSRPWRMEGFGSAPPPLSQQEKPRNGIGGFLNRFRNNNTNRRGGDPDLRTMRVATEDTKDDKTVAEQVAKAALVVLVPELFDEDDGDANLGMYRSLNTATDEDADARMSANARGIALTNEVGWGVRNRSSLADDPSLVVRNEVRQLRQKVVKLDKALKSTELEASSWKLRCKELEQELRRYRGQNDLDSSIEADEDSDDEDDDEEESDEDDGIEEEWTGYDSVKVGDLLEMPANEEENKPVFGPLLSEAKEVETKNNLLDLPSTEKAPETDTPSLLDLPSDKATPEVDDAPSMLDMTAEFAEEPKEPEAPSLMDFSGDDTNPEVDDSPSLLDLTEPAPMVFDPLNEKVSSASVDAEMPGNDNA